MARISHSILKDLFRLGINELLPHIIVTVLIHVEYHLLKRKKVRLREVQEGSGHHQIQQSLNREVSNK
jgi:hypothetical protein